MYRIIPSTILMEFRHLYQLLTCSLPFFQSHNRTWAHFIVFSNVRIYRLHSLCIIIHVHEDAC